MSTRSQIAKMLPDGKVNSIYCHSDGYPSHNGELLLNHYNSEEKVDALLALGDLSFLDVNINPMAEAPARRNWEVDKDPNSEGGIKIRERNAVLTTHTFADPQEGVTIAYHRDRGEDFHVGEYNSLEDFLKAEHWAVYLYLWKDNKWHVSYYYKEKERFFELTPEIIKSGLPTEQE